MRLTLLQGPAVEPLGLDEAKAHLRLDGEDEDTLVGSLIATARSHIETALGLALITQTWRWQADRWPNSGVVDLMTRPVQRIDQIAVRQTDGTRQVVDASDYDVDFVAARVVPQSGARPKPGIRSGGIEIEFVAGFGDAVADVPEPIRHALRLLTAHWYEVRNPVHIGSMATRVPETVSELLMPYRARRL